jgi:hypothetical protein
MEEINKLRISLNFIKVSNQEDFGDQAMLTPRRDHICAMDAKKPKSQHIGDQGHAGA